MRNTKEMLGVVSGAIGFAAILGLLYLFYVGFAGELPDPETGGMPEDPDHPHG
ncbi:MAG: hypothetical protein ACE5F4_01995 [Candidatus Paceibacteria bacterium]